MRAASRSGPITISGVERDASTVRHGVARVQHQVQDDLLNLGWVHPHQAQIIREFDNQFDILANQAAEQIAHIRYNVIHAEQTRFDCPLPRYRHQLLDEARALLPSLTDLLGETPQRWFSSSPARISSLQSTIPVSRLLKSWATPPPGGRWPPSCEHPATAVRFADGRSILLSSPQVVRLRSWQSLSPFQSAVESRHSRRAPHLGSLGGLR